ncbi:MAG: AI-2E family transporter [Pyrinomonadaceae bacterium]|nr:AI-2E family transporter [Blastocatellia bacterium]MCW5955126.1 AI-2E family transporter [Pyrinomonadaceae bacterium]
MPRLKTEEIENDQEPGDGQELSQAQPVRVILDPSSPSIRSIVRVVIVAMIFVFVLSRVETVVGSLTYLFFLVVLSVFFAYLIDPLVKLIRKPFKARSIEKAMPRSFAIVIAYLLVFTVLGFTIAGVAPSVSQQAREFGANIPAYGSAIQRSFNDLNRRFDRLRIPDEVQTKINEQAVALGERITTGVGGFVLSFVTFIPWLIIIPILSFFFLKDVNSFRLAVLKLFPAGRWRMRADSVLGDANATLAAYVRAMLISCVLIGVVCTIGFYIIGLKYALLLGILAGVFEFVPLLGPAAIGIIVIITAAVSDNPWNAIPAAIFLIVLRIVHDYVTYPRIVRGGIHLHPVAIILSVLAGEQIAGIPGVFLAIPVVALLTVAYKHFLEHQGSRTLFEGLVHKEELEPEEQA